MDNKLTKLFERKMTDITFINFIFINMIKYNYFKN